MSGIGIPDGQSPEQTAVVFAALARAQDAAEDVEKRAKNQHHDYKYASAEAIIGAKHSLNKEGLTLLPISADYEQGKLEAGWADLRRSYWLTHESGARLIVTQVWPFQPSRGRPWDKAVAAALTSSLAYAYRDILGLSRVDESGSIDDRDDTGYDPRRERQQPPKQPRAAPTNVIVDWLRNAPGAGSNKDERRAYVDKAKAAQLGPEANAMISALVFAGANVGDGKDEDEGMTEPLRKALRKAHAILEKNPPAKEESTEGAPVEEEPPAAPAPEQKKAAPAKTKKAGKKGRAAPKMGDSGESDGGGEDDGDGENDGGGEGDGDPPPEPAPTGDLWDEPTQQAKLKEFLVFIEGSPSPQEFSKLARGPRMAFDEKHLTLLSVAIELRQAAIDKRKPDPELATKDRLDHLRALVDQNKR